MKTLDVYLDMDIVAYRAAAAVQEVHNWDDSEFGLSTTHCDINQAVLLVSRIVDSTIRCIEEHHEVGTVFGCFSCPTVDNFRLSFDPNYKSNRKGLAKPVGLPRLREIMMEDTPFDYEALWVDTLEADDVLGIDGFNRHDEVVMVSDDKDLMTVPGTHMKFPKQGAYELVRQNEEAANKVLLTQCLTGDDADGIKGIKGIGPVKARRILEGKDTKACLEAVKEEYLKAGMTQQDLERTFRLLYILRDHDQNKPIEEILGIN